MSISKGVYCFCTPEKTSLLCFLLISQIKRHFGVTSKWKNFDTSLWQCIKYTQTWVILVDEEKKVEGPLETLSRGSTIRHVPSQVKSTQPPQIWTLPKDVGAITYPNGNFLRNHSTLPNCTGVHSWEGRIPTVDWGSSGHSRTHSQNLSHAWPKIRFNSSSSACQKNFWWTQTVKTWKTLYRSCTFFSFLSLRYPFIYISHWITSIHTFIPIST